MRERFAIGIRLLLHRMNAPTYRDTTLGCCKDCCTPCSSLAVTYPYSVIGYLIPLWKYANDSDSRDQDERLRSQEYFVVLWLYVDGRGVEGGCTATNPLDAQDPDQQYQGFGDMGSSNLNPSAMVYQSPMILCEELRRSKLDECLLRMASAECFFLMFSFERPPPPHSTSCLLRMC